MVSDDNENYRNTMLDFMYIRPGTSIYQCEAKFQYISIFVWSCNNQEKNLSYMADTIIKSLVTVHAQKCTSTQTITVGTVNAKPRPVAKKIQNHKIHSIILQQTTKPI